MSESDTITLTPGCYIDSHWGHYQSVRIIELAIALGYEDKVLDENNLRKMLRAYNENEDCVVYTRKDYAHDPDREYLDHTTNLMDWVNETVEDAEDFINDRHVPEGYWFGHHPDMGDIGVYPMEDKD